MDKYDSQTHTVIWIKVLIVAGLLVGGFVLTHKSPSSDQKPVPSAFIRGWTSGSMATYAIMNSTLSHDQKMKQLLIEFKRDTSLYWRRYGDIRESRD